MIRPKNLRELRLSENQAFFASLRGAQPKCDDLFCTVVVDAEEDFNWLNPVRGSGYLTSSMMSMRDAQEILGSYGAIPAYLLTFPILEDEDVVRMIRRQIENERCVVGIQLHPWVTPPFDEEAKLRNSFAGNLDPVLEEKKICALKLKFNQCFGFDPVIYRAGRYGLSQGTAALLEKHGFTIDTSVAPMTTFKREGGPDYTEFDYRLFWFGERRNLLEIPLCRSVVGWGGAWSSSLYAGLSTPRFSRVHAQSILARSRLAERITLSPEGNDISAMCRLVRGLRTRGVTIFPLSFHSTSLCVGRNPYVQSKKELHAFYDSLSGILDYMMVHLSFKFSSILDIPTLFTDPHQPRPINCKS